MMIDLDRLEMYLLEHCRAIRQEAKKPFLVFRRMQGPTTIVSGNGAIPVYAQSRLLEGYTTESLAIDIYDEYDWVTFYTIDDNYIRFAAGSFDQLGLDVKLVEVKR